VVPDDDDADCAEHDFVIQQVLAGPDGARLIHECARCGAVSYEASRADETGTGT
jgi:hypothetical protein